MPSPPTHTRTHPHTHTCTYAVYSGELPQEFTESFVRWLRDLPCFYDASGPDRPVCREELAQEFTKSLAYWLSKLPGVYDVSGPGIARQKIRMRGRRARIS